MRNFHHDENNGNSLSDKALGYCDNSGKFSDGAFEFQKNGNERRYNIFDKFIKSNWFSMA